MVRNTYIYPPEPSMRIISDIFAFTSAEMPKFNSISISGYHMQEAGATADLELGYTLADGVEYIRAGLDAGLTIDAFAPRLSFFWAIGMNFFMEVAEAARRPAAVGQARQAVRARRATSRCRCARTARRRAGRSPRRTCSTTSCARASRRWPPRRATPSRCTPTRSTRRSRCRPTSRRASPATPSCSCSRSPGTTQVIDPWGGSYYVERLTADLAAKAWAHIEEVEATGGMTAAIEAGIPKLRIEEAAARTQARIDSGRQPVIGVNMFRPDEPTTSRCSRSTTPRCARQQIAKLRAAARRARPAACDAALDALTAPPRLASTAPRPGLDQNLLKLSVDAARAEATVGEISDALEKVFGRHTPRSVRSPACTATRSAIAERRRACARARRRVRRARRAAGRASSSPRWARTATTAARR